MNTPEIAERLITLCRQGDFATAQKELFADDAVSIEPYETPGFPKETKGKAAIAAKMQKFQASIDQLHAIEVSTPLAANQSFTCKMRLDVTMKGKGRMDMSELCVYEIRDGRIISERFFV